MYFANCHNHSTFSDGMHTPEQLVSLAKQIGHRAIVLTDHDTVRGTYFLEKAARRAGLLSHVRGGLHEALSQRAWMTDIFRLTFIFSYDII